MTSSVTLQQGSADGEEIVETPVARVAPARKIIQRAKDLLPVTEGKLLAVKALAWRSHVFHEGEPPTRLVVLGVVDVSDDEPGIVGVVDVSWTRVVRLFEVVDPNEWQVGYLRRDADANDAVELQPPNDDVDLERIARMLGPLQLAAPTAQLALPAGEQLTPDEAAAVDEEEGLADGDPPF